MALKLIRFQWPPDQRLLVAVDSYVAKVRTDRGDILIDLFANECPALVNNFIFLATNEFYNDTTFHRVLEGFVVQAGDRTGSGAGEPGYFINDEPSSRSHLRGTISMANSGPNTNGSQFFIPCVDMPWLDKLYCPIGQILDGFPVLDSIRQGDKIHVISIYRKGIAQELVWDNIVTAWETAEKASKKSSRG